jgi:hypothetical protein
MSDLLQQADSLRRSGDLTGAQKLYYALLATAPDHPDAHHGLGMIYGQQGNAREAVREVSLSLQARPSFAEGWFELCDFADQMRQYELSRFAGEQAVRLQPDFARAWLRYGLALSRLEKDEDAIKAFQRAIALDPAQAKAWVNLAVVLKSLGRFAEAESALCKAINSLGQKILEPDADENDYGLLHWHLALLELLAGKYRQGFAHFRARFKGGTDWKRFESAKPPWRGEDLHDKTLLVLSEQGHGDVLMMCRYLPMLKAKGAHILFQVHPALARLFQRWAGADEIIAIGAPLPTTFDYHTSIFDLPYWLHATIDTIPAPRSYLPILEPDAKTQLPETGRPRIGVIWAGQPDNIRGKNRSVPLTIFAAIFSQPGLDFYCLTRDMRAGEEEMLTRYPVNNLAPLLADFADSARLIRQMDLIISCDTATAHLAGGMGIKTWVLLPFVADWRWALEREDNVWYPSMRLFRQTRKDEWESVMTQVKAELNKEYSKGT